MNSNGKGTNSGAPSTDNTNAQDTSTLQLTPVNTASATAFLGIVAIMVVFWFL
jgi:hypothetical protein